MVHSRFQYMCEPSPNFFNYVTDRGFARVLQVTLGVQFEALANYVWTGSVLLHGGWKHSARAHCEGVRTGSNRNQPRVNAFARNVTYAHWLTRSSRGHKEAQLCCDKFVRLSRSILGDYWPPLVVGLALMPLKVGKTRLTTS